MMTMSSVRTEDPKKELQLKSKRNVLSASENQDILNQMLARDEEKFRQDNGGFHGKTEAYVLKRIEEYPPFAEVAAINTLGVDCNVVEVNELVAEQRWKASQQPYGPAYHREVARRPKPLFKGFTPKQLKKMKQDKFDVDFWTKIRKGEYEARSFLNRITAIDEVAEVQKELSKAEIIKMGNYRLLRKEATPYEQSVSMHNWDKSILASWDKSSDAFPAVKDLSPDEPPRTRAIKDEDPYSRYVETSSKTNRYLHGNGGVALTTGYTSYSSNRKIVAMNEFLVLAKQKREQRDKELAAAAKAEKRALAKIQKNRASVIANVAPTSAITREIDITYGDGGSTARSSIVKPKPLTADARRNSMNSMGTASTSKKSLLPPLPIIPPLETKRRRSSANRSNRRSNSIQRQTSRETLVTSTAPADTERTAAQETVATNEPPQQPPAPDPPVTAAPAKKTTGTASYLTSLLFGPAVPKIVPEETKQPPATVESSLARRMSTTISNVQTNIRRKSIAITNATTAAIRRRSSVQAKPKKKMSVIPIVTDHSQDERLMETIMKAREAQRIAANRFRLWWSYLTGADLEPKHHYTVEDLMTAVTTGNYILAMDIIDGSHGRITPNTPSKSGDTALYLAVLLAHEGNPEEEEEQKRSIWRRLNCGRRNRLKGKLDWVIKVLLHCDGDLNHVREGGGTDGMTLLHYAVDKNEVGLIEWLLSYQVNMNCITSVYKRTPLMLAAMRGHNELVQLLLQYGAIDSINHIDTDGCNVMHYASLYLLPEYAQALMICGALPNIRNKSGRLPVEDAKAKGRTEMVEVLLRYKDRTRIVQNKLAFLNSYHKNILFQPKENEEGEEQAEEEHE